MLAEVSFREGGSNTLKATGNITVGLPGFYKAGMAVGGELESYADYAYNEKIYADDQVSCINRVVEICKAKGIKLVLVLDDTDKFFLGLSHLVDDFSTYVMPFIRDLECAVIFPVHYTYREHRPFLVASARTFSKTVLIPKITYQTFEKMINKRVSAVVDSALASEFFSQEAIQYVYNTIYRDAVYPAEKIRKSIKAFHVASVAALKTRENYIDRSEMEFSCVDI